MSNLSFPTIADIAHGAAGAHAQRWRAASADCIIQATELLTEAVGLTGRSLEDEHRHALEARALVYATLANAAATLALGLTPR